MTRSPESTKQKPRTIESAPVSKNETPLFYALKMEYLKGSAENDLEVITNSNGLVVAAFAEGAGSEAARSEYGQLIKNIPADASEKEVPVYLEMSHHAVREKDSSFPRPAAIYELGTKTFWNASTEEGATGLAVVSDTQGVRLGVTENAGMIDSLPTDHRIVMADNILLEQLEKNNALTLKGVANGGVRELYPLYDAVIIGLEPQTKEQQPSNFDAIAQRVEAKRLRKLNRTAAAEKPATVTAANEPATEEAKGYTVTDKRHRNTPGKDSQPVIGDNVSSLGISDAIRDEMEIMEKERLAERVEKYTQKVASYEEVAAEALGRRMKGRLFSPLTRKNKNEARKDDQYMHLLEGYSRVLDAALMQQWFAEGYGDDEVATKIYEHQQSRQEARAARNRKELRKDKLGSFLDKYANMSKGKKIGVAIGAAAVFGTVGAVAATGGGVFAAAGGIGLAGVKVGKAYFQQRSKMYETGRDGSMRSPDKLVSVKNGEATTRTAIEQVFAGRQYDEKKREREIEKADRNKKVAVGVAALSAVAIGAGVAMEHSDDIQKLWNKPPMHEIPTEVGTADGSWVTEAPVPTPEPLPTPAPFEFSVDASTVTNGEGWYQTIQETTGVTNPAEQAAILQKIGPALQEKGWAYPMTDGTWGISRPGTLPRDVLELIKNSR